MLIAYNIALFEHNANACDKLRYLNEPAKAPGAFLRIVVSTLYFSQSKLPL